jgi:hypothetical protein
MVSDAVESSRCACCRRLAPQGHPPHRSGTANSPFSGRDVPIVRIHPPRQLLACAFRAAFSDLGRNSGSSNWDHSSRRKHLSRTFQGLSSTSNFVRRRPVDRGGRPCATFSRYTHLFHRAAHKYDTLELTLIDITAEEDTLIIRLPPLLSVRCRTFLAPLGDTLAWSIRLRASISAPRTLFNCTRKLHSLFICAGSPTSITAEMSHQFTRPGSVDFAPRRIIFALFDHTSGRALVFAASRAEPASGRA